MYAKNNISKGKILTEEDIYYAIPTSSDQYVANDFSKFNILLRLQTLILVVR